MIRIVFDTNILWNSPHFITQEVGDARFYIPEIVLHELRSKRDAQKRQLVEQIINSSWSNLEILENAAGTPPPRLSQADQSDLNDESILNATLVLKEEFPNDEVYLATRDIRLSIIAGKNNVATLDLPQLTTLFDRILGINAKLKKSHEKFIGIKEVESKFRISLRRLLFLNLSLAAMVAAGAISQLYVVSSIQAPLVRGIFVFSGGPILFFFRSRFGKAYGIAEVIVGLAAAYKALSPLSYLPPEAVPLLGGLYIVVRGMDNIDKKLDAATWHGALWAKIFRPPETPLINITNIKSK